jgi:steroid delta-isomerase-like uncharacterized protein
MAAAWNSQDLSTFLQFLSDDVEWSDPAMPEPTKGRDAVRKFAETVLAAFPDFAYQIRPPVCVATDGTRVAVPWTIVATQTGPFDPPGFQPTGSRVEFEGVDVLDFSGSRVRRIQTLFDPAIPAEQLLQWRLRPPPGSWRERALVWLQRLRAASLRGRRNRSAISHTSF